MRWDWGQSRGRAEGAGGGGPRSSGVQRWRGRGVCVWGGTITWKSRAGDHTQHWHIWGGTKYPDLSTHTHTQLQRSHKNIYAASYKRTHTPHTGRACATKRRQTSRHRHHHSSAYTHWPLLLLESVKHNEAHRSRNNAQLLALTADCTLIGLCDFSAFC